MNHPDLSPNRRAFLKSAAAGLAAAGALGRTAGAQDAAAADAAPKSDPASWYVAKNGNINQSVVSWCYKPVTVEELIEASHKMGCKSVELIPPSYWPLLKERGMTCAIAGSHGFAKGFAHTEEHEECLAKLRESIDACHEFGCKNVITFSGFRRELATEDGFKNMVAGLKKIMPYAEEKKVNICLEMLNSRVEENMKGHPDYMCDDMDWAIEICKAVGSERAKVLFDIYHVQIMQGDVITRLRQYKDYIGHYHTAGNPGRCEIDDRQEINYPGIMKAIVETGYDGYVGQEFIPQDKDILKSLNDGVRICDV